MSKSLVHHAAAVVTLCAASFSVSGQTPSGKQLILIDGRVTPYQSLEIAGGQLSGDGVPADLTLDDLRRIDISGEAPASGEKSAALVELQHGGRILAKSVAIADEKCQIEWSGGERLSLPVDLVLAIRFEATAGDEVAMAAASPELDRILIKDNAGKITSVSGLIESLDAEQIRFKVGEQDRSVPRAKIAGIVVAQSAATRSPSHCLVTFRDGSSLGGEDLSLRLGQATLGLPSGEKVGFSWSAAARVTIRSSRVAFVSDLKSVVEEQHPIVTFPMAAQRDRSASGKPLTLGGRSYEKGIGVHARSVMTFSANKKWDSFAATIGLDGSSGGLGDCTFVVLADGESLLSHRMKGSDPPAEIQLSIAGREQVTLVVEPGEGLDLADHANWCDARFVKNK